MSLTISETDLILNPDGGVYHLGLHPEHLTDIILTVGDPERVPKVSQYFDRIETKQAHREFCAHIGYLGTQRLMVISSGMGTDNVEILMTELDALANVELTTRTVKEARRSLTIVRIGTSGALQPDIPLDSYVVNRSAFGLDTLMQFYPPVMNAEEQQWSQQLREHLSLGFTPYCTVGDEVLLNGWDDLLIGTTVTCPGFYAPQGRQIRVAPRFSALSEKLSDFRFGGQRLTNFEMETSGYYALGRLLGHRVISLNAILANRVTQTFSKQPSRAIDKLIRRVLDRISN